jgi:hypothetical protein
MTMCHERRAPEGRLDRWARRQVSTEDLHLAGCLSSAIAKHTAGGGRANVGSARGPIGSHMKRPSHHSPTLAGQFVAHASADLPVIMLVAIVGAAICLMGPGW